jgi:hypothetical protein
MLTLLKILPLPFLLAGPYSGNKVPDRPAAMPRLVTYRGMCDASGASILDPDHFIVGNDEDNILRIYGKDSPDPVMTVPLDAFVGLSRDEKNPETDIEASARVGDVIYWMCSHGRNTEGKIRKNRQRFFAVRAAGTGGIGSGTGGAIPAVTPAGLPYGNLVRDLLRDPKLKGLGLAEAAGAGVKKNPDLAPKKRGLNIEGLSRMPSNRGLMIGFRNPAPGGKALLVPFLNPEAVIFRGERAVFGDPALLDLGGFSVRSIEYVDLLDAYLVIAGPEKGGSGFRLYTWSGNIRDRAFPFPCETAWMAAENFTPEAFVVFPEAGELLLISDDGTLPLRTDGTETACPCKLLEDPADRRFRGAFIPLKKE